MCILNLFSFRVFFIEKFGLSSQAANVINKHFLASVFCLFVCERVSHSPGWFQIHCLAEV